MMVQPKLSEHGIDRLSNLPHHLLSHILSLLPTEIAVATSVLSTRWKFLWTSVTTLNFDYRLMPLYKDGLSMKRAKSLFTLFVNRVFFLITPNFIQIFRLRSTHGLVDPLHLNLWITLIAPTVQELDLNIMSASGSLIELQMNQFRFNKLVVLKLRSGTDFKIPPLASACFPNLQILHLSEIRFEIANNSSVSFPKLKILHLDSVKYKDVDSARKLISSCPVLDDLDINMGHKNYNIRCLIICVPSLITLKLGHFHYINSRAFDYQIVNLCKLKFLSISGHALKAIATSSSNIFDFPDLKTLELEVCDFREWCVVINLLGSMDRLEHLVLMRKSYQCCSCSQKPRWIEPLNVPKCLVSRVNTISFKQTIDYCHDELELVRYFLKNAKVLKVLKLGTVADSSEKNHQLIEKISMFPKRSHTCQVVFT